MAAFSTLGALALGGALLGGGAAAGAKGVGKLMNRGQGQQQQGGTGQSTMGTPPATPTGALQSASNAQVAARIASNVMRRKMSAGSVNRTTAQVGSTAPGVLGGSY
jgi:hypothetical protein